MRRRQPQDGSKPRDLVFIAVLPVPHHITLVVRDIRNLNLDRSISVTAVDSKKASRGKVEHIAEAHSFPDLAFFAPFHVGYKSCDSLEDLEALHATWVGALVVSRSQMPFEIVDFKE